MPPHRRGGAEVIAARAPQPTQVIAARAPQPSVARRWARQPALVVFRVGSVLAGAVACGQILNVEGIEIVLPQNVAGAGGGSSTACTPGEFRCEGASLRLCEASTGEFRTVRVCSSDELCCADPQLCDRGQPGCIAPTCLAGELRCQGDILEECNAGQTGFIPIDRCQSALHCNASLGRCTEQPCDSALRQQQCNGSTLEECLPERSAWSPLEYCTTRALCSPEASCEQPACRIGGPGNQPSPYICMSGNLMRCNDAQTGWEFVETCLNPANCNALINELVGDPYATEMTTRQLERLGCTTPVCSPGRYLCQESTLRLCDANRTAYTAVDTCQSPRHCDANSGRCMPQPCVVGDRQCSGDEHQVCTETGWRVLDRCDAGSPCDPEGGCRPAVCNANEYRCTGAELERCNVARTGWIPVNTCTTAALCNVAAKRCEAPVCAPNERRCTAAGVLERCNEDRTGWSTLSDCVASAAAGANDASALCDPSAGGRCLPSPSCTAGFFRCNGAELELCRDNAWHPHDRCTTAAQCDAIGGSCLVALCEPGQFRCVTPGSPPVPAEDGASRLGLQLEVCNDFGTAFEASRECARLELCDDEHGQCDICDPSLPLLCSANRLQVCTADGQELTPLKVCTMGCDTVQVDGTSRTTCLEDLAVPSSG
jgi:hypothetical protein